MKFFKFRKKKGDKERPPEEIKKPTELELLCGDDKELYQALYDTMPPNPRGSNVSMEEAAQKAKEFEKSGNKLQAGVWYHIAGGLAIYQGNVEKVKEYFGKCQKLSNRQYPILKIPEKAVAKAQEYYKKYLKLEEKK
jgi:hypothetical protein